MDHSYYRDKISAYSDGALEAQERELIRRHLEECADCRNLLDKLNQLSAVIEEKSALKNDEYFENLAKKIERRISTPDEKVVDIRGMRWNSFWWKISAAAATIVLVGTIGFYQYQDGQEMPGKILENIQVIPESVLVNTDSVSANEEAEVQGGRTDTKELVGKVADEDKALKKKSPAETPDTHEKDEQQLSSAAESQSFIETKAPSVVSAQKSEVMDDKEDKASVTQFYALPDSVAVQIDKFGGGIPQWLFPSNTLLHWQTQRDSIQNLLAIEQDTVQVVAKNELKELASPSVSGVVQSNDSSKNYLRLANSWYQISLQTQDSTEKFRAIQFLNWYKNRFPADSPMVNQQLQQIPK